MQTDIEPKWIVWMQAIVFNNFYKYHSVNLKFIGSSKQLRQSDFIYLFRFFQSLRVFFIFHSRVPIFVVDCYSNITHKKFLTQHRIYHFLRGFELIALAFV